MTTLERLRMVRKHMGLTEAQVKAIQEAQKRRFAPKGASA